ncbi:MAG: hypothetical protein VX185_10875 [Pseudomonadota bacterium]|nr:hypothetical protein [Pseudomonadota bacterium]
MGSNTLQSFKMSLMVILAAFILSTSALASTQCTQGAYVVGFFNGVWNTERETRFTTAVLQERFELDVLPQVSLLPASIDYEYFYNHTGTAVGASRFQDIAEVFIQRADALGVGSRYELIWNALSGDTSFLSGLRRYSSDGDAIALNALEDAYSNIGIQLAGDLSTLLSDPPTASDYAAHEARLSTLLVEGKSALLVSHSQGHFFAEHAYRAIESKAVISSMDAIRTLHVAPPATNIIHDYVLADKDYVIQSLSVFGHESILGANTSIPYAHLLRDITGHEFIKTYLRDGLEPYGLFQSYAAQALASLYTQDGAIQNGLFNVTLTWGGLGDIDLHVIEPNGAHVSFKKPQGASGVLDLDNRIGYGPEHYYASCDVSHLQVGRYLVAVNNFMADAGQEALVQVSSNQGRIVSQSVGIGEALGDAALEDLTYVFSIDLSLDPLHLEINAIH